MSERCEKLHNIFNNFKRHTFPYIDEDIPMNGIYILFEKGESGHGCDRIVRIGTHTGYNQLRSRLNQHFILENKDRSIFRKNIGRALLNRNKDDYIKYWELDLTSRKYKEKYLHLIDQEYQLQLEKEVTKIINNNFSFVVIEENDKDARLFYEAKLISEVSSCTCCKPSANWLGRFSTKEKIQESGLWQVNQLYKECFKTKEYIQFLEKGENYL